MSAFKALNTNSAFTWANHAYDILTSHFQPGSDPLSEDGKIVFGTSGNDIIARGETSRGSDIVFSGAGDDVIVGYGSGGPSPAADSAYAAADKADYLDGGAGNDSIEGAGGNDIIYGGAGNDGLLGGAGDDIVYGGSGNDVISSGQGTDLLWGGAGRDVFSYYRNATSGGIGEDARYGVDTIFDFKPGTDKLEFQDFSPIAGSLRLIDNGHALEVHFDYNYIGGVNHAEVDLAGVHSLKPGDLVFV
jgi:Ca2+-binding RTX toxin-like protein